MPWTYAQATGVVTAPSGTDIGVGYSGNGDGLNNPAMESVANVGPLPAGWYTIGPAYHHPHLGPNTMDLTPDPDTDTHGRDDFRIHGDNAEVNFTASHGCLVAPPEPRGQIAASPDRRLHVVAGA